MNHITYIKEISPRGDYSARLRQYQSFKNKLLPQYPPEQHGEIIRALCRRLKI